MSDGDGEADGEGGRSQASVPSLVGHGEDAHHELHGEENLHCGRHSQTDARLQLETHRWTKGVKIWHKSKMRGETFHNPTHTELNLS